MLYFSMLLFTIERELFAPPGEKNMYKCIKCALGDFGCGSHLGFQKKARSNTVEAIKNKITVRDRL